MSAYIEIRSPIYLKTKPDETRFPDLASCITALPLAYAHGVTEFLVKAEGETHGRRYTLQQVEEAVGLNPLLSRLQGLGNVDPEFGWNYLPGRHIPFL